MWERAMKHKTRKKKGLLYTPKGEVEQRWVRFVCPVDGVKFIPNRTNNKYCSIKCRNAAYYKRKKNEERT